MDEIELPEVAGKTVTSAKVLRSKSLEQELAIEFTDGTTLSFCCASRTQSEVTLYRGGVGEPEIIRNLEVK